MKKALSHSEHGTLNKSVTQISSQHKDKLISHSKTKSTSTAIPKLDLTKIKRDVEIESDEYEGQIISEDMVIVDEMKVQDYSEELRHSIKLNASKQNNFN